MTYGAPRRIPMLCVSSSHLTAKWALETESSLLQLGEKKEGGGRGGEGMSTLEKMHSISNDLRFYAWFCILFAIIILIYTLSSYNFQFIKQSNDSD